MKKREAGSFIFALLLVFQLVMICLPLPAQADEKPKIAIGDYCYFGNYNDRPILWRCIARRDEGFLMIADSILCYKAFDADTDAENQLPDDVQNAEQIRAYYGSNEWKSSTLRKWLNSKGDVQWEGKTPGEGFVTSNPYQNEIGFLSSFTDDELKFIVRVKNKSVVNVCDPADDGTEVHNYSLDYRLESSIENYQNAFSQYIYDDIFLLNTPELVEMQKNVGGKYVVANVKDSALDEEDNWFIDDASNVYYWLRDAYADNKFPEGVRCVFPGGHEYYMNAHNGDIGVRPAFVMSDSVTFSYGYGTRTTPYSLTNVKDEKSSRDQTPEASQTDSEKNQTTNPGTVSVKIGDYISMGILDGEPILWRCVDINENGPLMLSDKILRFYSFDAAGYHENDKDNRKATYGSNLWSTSSLRYWLNSDLDKWGDYPGIAVPNSQNVYYGYSPYSNAPGFLTSFTREEQDMILATKLTSLVNELDAGIADSGEKANSLRRKVTLVDGYGSSLSVVTTDKIFLLNRLEAKAVYDNFESYLLAKPTAGAVRQSDYKTTAISEGKTWHYWLRDAFGGEIYPYYTMDVTTDGRISSDFAYSAQYGVRPAFILDVEKAVFEKGDGSEGNPFIARRHLYVEKIIRNADCSSDGELLRTCEICGASHSERIKAEGHDLKVEVIPNLLLKDTRIYSCSKCDYVSEQRGLLKNEVAIGGLVLILLCAAPVVWWLYRRSRH